MLGDVDGRENLRMPTDEKRLWCDNAEMGENAWLLLPFCHGTNSTRSTPSTVDD